MADNSYCTTMQFTGASWSQNKESQSVAQSIAELLRDPCVIRQLHRTAEREAWLPKDSVSARDLVADVIGELATGVLTCDERALEAQLVREVRRRAHRYRRAAERSMFMSLEEAPPSALIEAKHEEARQDPSWGRDAAGVVERIRQLAANDAPVLQLLALHERGLSCRRHARIGGMSPSIYRRARERLVAYATNAIAMEAASEPSAT
jgi:hypothetical protein